MTANIFASYWSCHPVALGGSGGVKPFGRLLRVLGACRSVLLKESNILLSPDNGTQCQKAQGTQKNANTDTEHGICSA